MPFARLERDLADAADDLARLNVQVSHLEEALESGQVDPVSVEKKVLHARREVATLGKAVDAMPDRLAGLKSSSPGVSREAVAQLETLVTEFRGEIGLLLRKLDSLKRSHVPGKIGKDD